MPAKANKLTVKVKQKNILKYTLFSLDIFFMLIFSILIADRTIIVSTRNLHFSEISATPQNNVGLVLGTSGTLRNGNANLYFKYRIDAAAQLYHSGKVKHLIVSGDNHVDYYNEPEEMRLALIKKGVPDTCITLDFAGFRTLDSVVRCWKVFGQKKFTIISQKFHNERALFIANAYGLDAVAFDAKDVTGRGGRRTAVREPMARFKAVLDLYLFNKQPKFLGKREYVKL